jgi:hypothetical protein
MGPSVTRTWLLLIDHNFQTIGGRFLVDTTGDDLVYHLKREVKEKRRIDLAHVDAARLTLWRCTDPTLATAFDDEGRQVREVFSKKKVKILGVGQTIAQLQLLKKETLLVVVPGGVLLAALIISFHDAHKSCHLIQGDNSATDSKCLLLRHDHVPRDLRFASYANSNPRQTESRI